MTGNSKLCAWEKCNTSLRSHLSLSWYIEASGWGWIGLRLLLLRTESGVCCSFVPSPNIVSKPCRNSLRSVCGLCEVDGVLFFLINKLDATFWVSDPKYWATAVSSSVIEKSPTWFSCGLEMSHSAKASYVVPSKKLRISFTQRLCFLPCRSAWSMMRCATRLACSSTYPTQLLHKLSVPWVRRPAFNCIVEEQLQKCNWMQQLVSISSLLVHFKLVTISS